MSDWQPISTAPRDGTHVLAYCGDEWPVSVCWIEYDDALKEEVGEEGYFTYSDDVISDICEDVSPTHWMPLPEPPQ